MTYATKAKLIKYTLPLLIVVPCVLLGFNSTRELFAQAPPATGIGIAVAQSQYIASQNVVVTLSNSTATSVYVINNCPNAPLSVYRLEHNTWVSLQAATSISKCAGEPQDYAIPANASVQVSYRDWSSLFSQPGEYRIVANIEDYSLGPSVDFNVVD